MKAATMLQIIVGLLLCTSTLLAQGVSINLTTPYVVPASYRNWNTDGDPPTLYIHNDRPDSFYCTIQAVLIQENDTICKTSANNGLRHSFPPGLTKVTVSDLIGADLYTPRPTSSMTMLPQGAIRISLLFTELFNSDSLKKNSIAVKSNTAVHAAVASKIFEPKNDSIFYKNDSVSIYFTWPEYDTVAFVNVYNCSAKQLMQTPKMQPIKVLEGHRVNPWNGGVTISLEKIAALSSKNTKKHFNDTLCFTAIGLNFNTIASAPIEIIVRPELRNKLAEPARPTDNYPRVADRSSVYEFDEADVYTGGIIRIKTDSSERIHADSTQRWKFGNNTILLLHQRGNSDTLAITRYQSYSGMGDDTKRFWNPEGYDGKVKFYPPVISQTGLEELCKNNTTPFWGSVARFYWHPEKFNGEHLCSTLTKIEGVELTNDNFSPLQYANGMRYNLTTKRFEHLSTLKFKGFSHSKECWVEVEAIRKK